MPIVPRKLTGVERRAGRKIMNVSEVRGTHPNTNTPAHHTIRFTHNLVAKHEPEGKKIQAHKQITLPLESVLFGA
jgi:hypothetical protein